MKENKKHLDKYNIGEWTRVDADFKRTFGVSFQRFRNMIDTANANRIVCDSKVLIEWCTENGMGDEGLVDFVTAKYGKKGLNLMLSVLSGSDYIGYLVNCLDKEFSKLFNKNLIEFVDMRMSVMYSKVVFNILKFDSWCINTQGYCEKNTSLSQFIESKFGSEARLFIQNLL